MEKDGGTWSKTGLGPQCKMGESFRARCYSVEECLGEPCVWSLQVNGAHYAAQVSVRSCSTGHKLKVKQQILIKKGSEEAMASPGLRASVSLGSEVAHSPGTRKGTIH